MFAANFAQIFIHFFQIHIFINILKLKTFFSTENAKIVLTMKL